MNILLTVSTSDHSRQLQVQSTGKMYGGRMQEMGIEKTDKWPRKEHLLLVGKPPTRRILIAVSED